MILYHYTCHHGRLGIGDEGKLYAPVYLGVKFPPRTPPWQQALLELTWMTDLSEPDRSGLGLTSNTLGCDRTQFRYRVTNDQSAVHYPTIRRELPRQLREGLEAAAGALPMHWWLAYTPTPVVFEASTAALEEQP